VQVTLLLDRLNQSTDELEQMKAVVERQASFHDTEIRGLADKLQRVTQLFESASATMRQVGARVLLAAMLLESRRSCVFFFVFGYHALDGVVVHVSEKLLIRVCLFSMTQVCSKWNPCVCFLSSIWLLSSLHLQTK
jgi:hypothetical protein